MVSAIVTTMDQVLAILPIRFQPDTLLPVHVPGIGVIVTLLIIQLVGWASPTRFSPQRRTTRLVRGAHPTCGRAHITFQFGAHSLRSGFITERGRLGKALGERMALSGHHSTRIAMGYHQAGAVVHNPAARLAD